MPPASDADRSNDPSTPSPAETFVCSMCRQRAPLSKSLIMGGRRLCFGCASGWFEDEE